MKPQGVEKARYYLNKAKAALERVRVSRNFEQFSDAWVDFLAALNSVHSKLEAASEGNPKSYQWMSKKIHIRRKDPLLLYLHQARNAEEHGIEDVAEDAGIGVSVLGTGYIKSMVIVGGKVVSADFGHGPIPKIIERPKGGARLVSVRNSKYGDVFDPPTEHLGKPLQARSVTELGQIAIDYHAALIDDAAKLIPSR
jgi:hypothetical protein